MAAPDYLNLVQQLYIGYFGRPADPAGLAYWTAQIDAAGGNPAVAIAGFSASAESQALYGGMTSTQQVTTIYQNLFGRVPEPAGLAAWVALLDTHQLSASAAAFTILQSAGPGDVTAVANKLIAANAFTASVDTPAEIAGYSSAAAALVAHTFLAQVDASPASIADLSTAVATAVGEATGTGTAPPPPPPPPPAPAPPAPSFTASKDGADAVTFEHAGAAIAMTAADGVYTFTSGSTSATIGDTVLSITVPVGATLTAALSATGGILFPGAGTLALTDTTATAADLKALETAVTGLLDASAVTAITAATVADALAVLVTHNGSAGDTVKTAADVAVTLTSSSATATDLKTIEAATTGLVTATSIDTITDATVADATLLLITHKGTSGDAIDLGGTIAVTLTDTTATAADLKAIAGATSLLVDASSVTSITAASVADATLLLITQKGISGDAIALASDVNVTLTDTTATAADLRALEAATSGFVDGATITSITNATGSDAQAVLVEHRGGWGDTIQLADDVAITLASTSITGTVLFNIVNGTTGTVDARSVTSISTTSVSTATLALVTEAGRVTLAPDVTVNLSGGSATATDLSDIEAATTGLVSFQDANSTITGTLAEVQALLGHRGSTGDAIALADDVKITLSNTGTMAAADLVALDDATTGLVSAFNATAITGASVAQALQLLVDGATGGQFSHKADVAVTLAGTTASAADLVAIETHTTGLVDASSITAITAASVADATLLLITDAGTADDTIRLSGSQSVTLTGTTATAAALVALETRTTGLVDASAITAITNAQVADATLLLITDRGTSDNKVNINAAVAITLAGTSATAAELVAIEQATTGLVDASSITTLTGLAADANQLVAIDAGTTDDKISMAGDVAITLTGTSTDAATLVSIETHTTGLVDASAITTLTASTIADVLQILSADAGPSGDKITMADDVAVTLNDTSASIADLLAIDGATSGLVDASSVTDYGSLTLAQATQLLVAENLTQWQHATDLALSLTDISATPTALNAIDAATTGLVHADSVAALTGLTADVATTLAAIGSGHITAANLQTITLADAVSAASFSSAVFNNNTTINLAATTGNSLTLAAGNVATGNTLTIDGSAATGSETINASAAIATSTLAIQGGAGDDTISSGKGFNTLTGGAGNDTFAFSPSNFSTFTGGQSGVATDNITDYRAAGAGTDVISFSGFTPQVGSNWNTVQDFTTQGFMSNALNFAASRNGTDNGTTVFIFGNDVYVYVEATGSNTSYNAGDFVVKLAGAKPFFAEGSAIAGQGFGGL